MQSDTNGVVFTTPLHDAARASAKSAPAGIWSGGSPEAASSRPLKLKNEVSAVISQTSRALQPLSVSACMSSLPIMPGASVSLLA